MHKLEKWKIIFSQKVKYMTNLLTSALRDIIAPRVQCCSVLWAHRTVSLRCQILVKPYRTLSTVVRILKFVMAFWAVH